MMLPELNRRQILQSAALSALSGSALAAASKPVPKGEAEHCIFLWLGGGAAQMDTFDPKRDPKGKKAGSYYDAIDTAVPGVQVCEHLPRVAAEMENITLCRTVFSQRHRRACCCRLSGSYRTSCQRHHSVSSVGSIVAHEKGTLEKGVPRYVVIGYPHF